MITHGSTAAEATYRQNMSTMSDLVAQAMSELGEENFSGRLYWYTKLPHRIEHLQRALFALAIEKWVRMGRGHSYAELARIGGVSVASIVHYRNGHAALTEKTERLVTRLVADHCLPADFTMKRSPKYPKTSV